MSIQTIQVPLPGERVVALSPQTATEAASDWLRRPNLFPGRALTAASLAQRQDWQAGHIAERGQDWVAGVVEGLQVSAAATGLPGFAGTRLTISSGRGLAVSGEDVVLNQHMDCALGDIPVVAPAGFFADGSGVGDTVSNGTLRARDVGVDESGCITLNRLVPAAQATLPPIGVLVLQPAKVDVSNFDAMDPCDRCACDEGAVDDTAAFEDWRIGDAVRLVWYVWPCEWNVIPVVAANRLRNALAWTVFEAEKALPTDSALPWEAFGVPIGIMALDSAQQVSWIDRASVVRQGGAARDARLQYISGALAANSRLPSLWQAQMEQFAEQVAAFGDPAPDPRTLASVFADHLPPVGLLPKNAFDPAIARSNFFPATFDIDAAPVPVEQLDLAVRANAPLAPLDPSAAESVRILVPVPLQSWEPRLLIAETIDPEFQNTLDRFVLQRARTLGARQGLRVRQSIIARAITGTLPAVSAWDDDADSVETETLTPWGPPPDGGGHRSSLLAGVHQHYFLQATSTLVVSANSLFVWVCLNPDNPPRSLMFQWHSGGSWEHRAYWGENLIGWGTDGTVSRMRMGDLPVAGEWIRLEVPVGSVGLAGLTVDGMAFALFDGQAAFAATGMDSSGVDKQWFSNILPAGAQLAGNEDFELLTPNDLWSPFEPTLGVLPVTPATLPATLGAHYDAPADGAHQHFFDNVTKPFTPATGENLFCWVYLDPDNPPSEIMLQWRTQDSSWEHRAIWGWDEIAWGSPGSPSRFHAGNLPQPGRWIRLEVSAASVGVEKRKLIGMAFTQYGGFAAFGAAGAGVPVSGVVGTERVWFAGSTPGGAVIHGLWNFLNASQMRAPTAASVNGQVQSVADLYTHPALQALSAQERVQVYLKGISAFSDYIRSRADRADDLVNHHFLQVQTDIYRVRQLMLGTTDASRLAVSPTLANIAKADTALATQTQLADFVSNLSFTSDTAAKPSAPAVPNATTTAQKASLAMVSPGISQFVSSNVAVGGLIGAAGGSVSQSTNLVAAKVLAADTSIQPILKSLIGFSSTPSDVINASPLVGQAFIRTTTIAERLTDPKAKTAHDYATATRFSAVQALIKFANSLKAEDGDVLPGLFNGLDIRGVNASDGFLAGLAASDDRVVNVHRPLTDFLADSTLVAKLMTPPSLGATDEGGFFSHTADLSDNVVALMRGIEGRIQAYRDIVTLCQQTLGGLNASASTVAARLTSIGDDLAEARHDVSVARALLAEETDRINAINTRRQGVLANEVKFLAFVRPREADNLRTTPTHSVDPGLLDAPVPACLREHPDVPEELVDMLRVLREAPANWFVKAPPILQRLDKIDHLVRLVQCSQMRAAAGIATPLLAAQANSGSKLGVAISKVAVRQVESLAPRIAAVQSLSIASFASATWNGIRAQAEPVVSFGDLADGGHGRADVSRAAAAELENFRSIVACLHAEFSGITPVLRLEWSTTLSEFDAAPNLRNLASLPRWAEIDYIDRRQMQGYVDWLFAQIQSGQQQAVALINDVVRMCLLLASHAPVDRIVTGRLARPITGVIPGVRIPLTVLEPAKLRIGMQALLYRGDALIARADVEDIGQQEISAHVVHTTEAKVDLGDDVRVHFDNAAMVSLNVAAASRTLFR